MYCRLRKSWTDVETCNDIMTGSDHKALKWKVRLSKLKKQKKRKGKKKCANVKVGWQPTSVEEYRRKLDSNLEDAKLKGDINERIHLIEEILLKVAQSCEEPLPEQLKFDTFRHRVRALITERQLHREKGASNAVTLVSKMIKSEVKAMKDSIKRAKV